MFICLTGCTPQLIQIYKFRCTPLRAGKGDVVVYAPNEEQIFSGEITIPDNFTARGAELPRVGCASRSARLNIEKTRSTKQIISKSL